MIVPNTYIGKIEFYESRIAQWSESATTIGLSAADCTALGGLITDARQAYNDQLKAIDASRAATLTMQNAVRAMHALGATDLAKIKAFAEATDNPNVYAIANIPAPATPSPIGPPGTPFDFVVTLLQNGAVQLKWKCTNPTGAVGTVYEVFRKVGPSGTLTYAGVTGVKTFTDAAIPAGSNGIMYQITGVRSTVRGNPAQFTVNFGVGGDGQTFAVVTPTGGNAVKLAA